MMQKETKKDTSMSKLWIVRSLVFVLIGAAGLSGVFLEKYIEQKETARYKETFSKGTKEYLDLYDQWCRMRPQQRMDNPWGQGKYGGLDIQKKLLQEQDGRLRADIVDIATKAEEPHVLADVLYGPNWRKEVEKYKKKMDYRAGITVASTIIICASSLIIFGCISTWSYHKLQNVRKKRRNTTNEKYKVKKAKQKKNKKTKPEPELENDEILDKNIDLQDPQNDEIDDDDDKDEEDDNQDDDDDLEQEQEEDEEEKQLQTVGANQGPFNSLKFKESLNNQADRLKNESFRYEQFTGNPELGTLLATRPIAKNSLTELTQEVSAIREYAAQQQHRVKQLQDGYDWGIIKRFCLRVIRCIDNLDGRIKKLAEVGEDIEYLEDVRDELLFALESSGVEQFEPEINSEYKGQERRVEAVREKLTTSNKKLSGKIAEVIRAGYEYVVSETEVKVVRAAQVKLYG